jgi:cytochrome d ubiquinol oxidase subunit II
MELFWFIIIAVVLAIFFVLDGYDFGTGIIHLFFAKKGVPRRDIFRALTHARESKVYGLGPC